MTFFLWCEWICSRCDQMHRSRFDVEVGGKAMYQVRDVFESEGIRIHDIAYRKTVKPNVKKTKSRYPSRIFVRFDDTIEKIRRVLRNYLLEFYAVKEETLTIEVCS